MSQTLAEIWFALGDPTARLRLEQAISALGYQPRAVTPAPGHTASAACAAVVTDLQPPGPSLSWIEDIRHARQGIPIVLYLPVHTGVDAALSRAMSLGTDAVIFQRGKPDERDRVRRSLAEALEQRVVANLLDGLAPDVPRSAVGFRVLKHYGIKLARSLDATDHVDTVAQVLDASPRTLQRMLHADGWPGPKELLDWMLLFQVALAGVVPEARPIRRRIRRAARRHLGLGTERAPTLELVRGAFVGRLNG